METEIITVKYCLVAISPDQNSGPTDRLVFFAMKATWLKGNQTLVNNLPGSQQPKRYETAKYEKNPPCISYLSIPRCSERTHSFFNVLIY